MSESPVETTEIPGQLAFEDLPDYEAEKFDTNGIIKYDLHTD